jgi:Transglycosylase SLT domain
MPRAETFTSRRGGIRRRARQHPDTATVVPPSGPPQRTTTAGAVAYSPPGVSPRTSQAAAVSRGLPVSPVAQATRQRGITQLNQALSSLTPAQRSLAPFAISAAREVGDVPASVLLALSGQESNYGQNQGPSSAGARGITQFIPSTRASFIQEYGVDPWKGPKEAFKATALYLKELNFKQDPQGALSGYSGGYASSAYNNPILSSAQNFRTLDKLAGSGAKIPGGGGGTKRSPASVAELFYDPGISLKEGSPIGSIGGHGTHVHVGSHDPRAEKKFINIARNRFGLNVGENLFVGDTPEPGVHVPGSMHYQSAKLPSGRPISLGADITGSPQAMMAYDRFIAKKFGGNPQVTGAAVGGFSAGYGGPVPVGAGGAMGGGTAAGGTAGGMPAAPAPPAYSPSQRSGISAIAPTAGGVSAAQSSLAALLGGQGGVPEEGNVPLLTQILSKRRYRPRR